MNAESDRRRSAPGSPSRGSATGDGRGEDAGDDDGAGGSSDEPVYGSRAPAFVQRSHGLHTGWRIGVFVVGLAVVGGGVILLPLPGPGWVVIFGGVAIWGTEFRWAQVLLHWVKRRVTQGARRVLEPRVRKRNLMLIAVVVAVCGAGLGAYLWRFGYVAPWRVDR